MTSESKATATGGYLFAFLMMSSRNILILFFDLCVTVDRSDERTPDTERCPTDGLPVHGELRAARLRPVGRPAAVLLQRHERRRQLQRPLHRVAVALSETGEISCSKHLQHCWVPTLCTDFV